MRKIMPHFFLPMTCLIYVLTCCWDLHSENKNHTWWKIAMCIVCMSGLRFSHRCLLHTVGFQSQISRMSSTAACLRGKEQEIKSQVQFWEFATSEKLNLSANCSNCWVRYLTIYCVKLAKNIWILWNGQAQDTKNIKTDV